MQYMCHLKYINISVVNFIEYSLCEWDEFEKTRNNFTVYAFSVYTD